MVKAGKENTPASELTIPDFNILKDTIEANGKLIVNDETVVNASDANSVFNATGGGTDNRRGIGFYKYQDDSIDVSIRGDVIMNAALMKVTGTTRFL